MWGGVGVVRPRLGSCTADVSALVLPHTATAHPHRTSSSVAADATVVAALTLRDLSFLYSGFSPPSAQGRLDPAWG